METEKRSKIGKTLSLETVLKRLGDEPTQQEVEFATNLYYGLGLVASAHATGYTKNYCFREIANRIGWNLTWRWCSRAPDAVDGEDLKKAVTGVTSDSRMVGTLTIDQCIERAKNGATLKEIGRVAGVTRERIRQVFYESSFNWMAVLQQRKLMKQIRNKDKRLAIQKVAADRKNLRKAAKVLADVNCERLKKMRELWDQGVEVSQISKIVECSLIKAQSDIYICRHHYGWFPYRRNECVGNKVKFPQAVDVSKLISDLQSVVLHGIAEQPAK